MADPNPARVPGEPSSRGLDALPVVYAEAMVATTHRAYGTSAEKPRQVAAGLRATGWPLRWVEPTPAGLGALGRVHDPSYVEGVLSLSRTNGFGTRSESVARSLRYTCGAFHTGALLALECGVSASLTCGFHHAHYDYGRGFCTFNGLMSSAVQLLDEGRVERVAIIDCDYHFGDGTQAILEHLGLERSILHVSFGEHLKRPDQAAEYLDKMLALREMLASFAPGIVLYQAGADTHVDDPLGGMLTTSQMRERDQRMFQIAQDLSIPLTWNLAGGYQESTDGTLPRVVELHLNTFDEALHVWRGG